MLRLSFYRFLCFILLGLSLAGLSACGFQPLYGDKAGVNQDTALQLAQIKIERVNDLEGVRFRNLLIARLNPRGEPSEPNYQLNFSLSHSAGSLGTQTTEQNSRAQLSATATFTLTGDDLDEPVKFSQRLLVGYLTGSDGYSNEMAKNKALENAMMGLADQAKTHLATLFYNDDLP